MLELNFSPFPGIKTERLSLRQLTQQDAPAIFELRTNDKAMQHIGKENAASLDEAKKLCDVIQDSLEKNEGITWAIALLNDPSTLIGTIGFWQISKQHYRAEIGYMLHPDHWRKGIMQEAINAVIEYGFGTLNLHSIEAHIDPFNTASAGILEKNGFVREAYFKEDYFFRGKFLDTAIYSRLNK